MHAPTMSPKEDRLRANGLLHRVLTWEPDGEARGTVLLAHGFLDVSWSWYRVAEGLTARGFRCIAWDWRGHGETEWIGAGGYYHFHDYVKDLDELWPQLVPEGARAHLVGHSMGGSAVTLYAGTRPERLASVALIEGLGPPAFDLTRAVEKVRTWLRTTEKLGTKEPRAPMSRLQVADRLRKRHGSELDEALLGVLVEEMSCPLADDPEARRWCFDPLHRSISPSPFQPEVFNRFLAEIGEAALPTLVVAGEKGFRPAGEETRRAALGDHTFVELPAAAHMMHWHHAPELVDAIAANIGRAPHT